ncbi:unnamed protein product [Soboliphyme baturini]|uniref:G_PROTEIN_RECEP_F1_2 domain-containing protein n=1 Tax=Soboliphyme baturini TaxID=241478 RepID=A0A183J9Y5_9BILA|nr:unnamed protein product [Soboliphyme baturini]
MLISGKLWELAADAVIPTLYWLSRRYLGKQQLKVSNKALRRTSNLVNRVNMKLLLIPLAFLVMRMWGTIRYLLYIADQIEAEQNCVLRTLHGFGDSFQGGTNCLLFCFMSDTIRRRLCFGWKKFRTHSSSELDTTTRSCIKPIRYGKSEIDTPRSQFYLEIDKLPADLLIGVH